MEFDTRGLKVFGGRKIKVKTIFLQRPARNEATSTEGLSVRIGWKHLSVFIPASVRLFTLLMLFFVVFFSPLAGDPGDTDSGVRRIRHDKMNHINEDHQPINSPFSVFLPSVVPFFFFLFFPPLSSGEPAPRLNCHRTVRPWQAALIHNAVAPLPIHPARKEGEGGARPSLGLKPTGRVTREPPTWLAVGKPDN